MAEATGPAPINFGKNEEFYLVWSPQGGEPMKRHDNFRSADRECYRLHALYPGKEFYVLKAKRLHPAASAPSVTEVANG